MPFPTPRRILGLQARHWESRITLAQANALRTCLWSLEAHLWNQTVDKAIETIREKDSERTLPKPKQRYSNIVEDDGREVIRAEDAFGNSHTYHL